MAGQIYHMHNFEKKDKNRIYATFYTTSSGFLGSVKQWTSPENLTKTDLDKMKYMKTYLSLESGSDYILQSEKSTLKALPASPNSLVTLVYEKDLTGIGKKVLKKDNK